MFAAAGDPVEVAGNVGRPLTGLVGARRPGRLDRLRALVLPARGRRDAAPAGRRAPQPRARPPRPPRHLRGLRATRSSGSSRTRTADDVAVVPRGFGPIPGAARRVEFAADDPLPAEPRIPGAHNRENAAAATAAARAAGIADDAIAEALRTFPGVPHRHRARARARGRPLRERLEGDERRRRAAARSPRSPAPGCT